MTLTFGISTQTHRAPQPLFNEHDYPALHLKDGSFYLNKLAIQMLNLSWTGKTPTVGIIADNGLYIINATNTLVAKQTTATIYKNGRFGFSKLFSTMEDITVLSPNDHYYLHEVMGKFALKIDLENTHLDYKIDLPNESN